VVAISGTIKKLQNRAIAYHRAITAQALAVHLDAMDKGDMIGRREEEGRMRREGEGEREAMRVLKD
jgi:ribonuclease P/MRP protein subunit POP5